MEKNIIKILSDNKLFAWYFNNRNCILIIGMIVLVIIAICMTKIIIRKVGKIEYKIIYGKPMAHIIIAIIIGNGLNAAGLKLEFSIEHMPILLLSSAMLITVSIQLAECIRFYRNFERVIKRTNIIVIGIIESMVLLLAIMGRLEIIELLVAVVGNITLKIINTFIDNCTRIQNKCVINNNLLTRDYSVEQEEDLFKSRKRQLNRICIELEAFSGEPFAIAISGEWGSGKTSFVNALKGRLKQVEFVNVECSIEYDIKAVLRELSSQLQEIYKNNNVYTERNGAIDKYFEKIGELVDDAGYGGMTKVIDKFQNNENSSYWENKAIMNQELDEFYKLTKKRIYFIIDDMDRIIDDGMRAVIFQVIRKSVELHNCVTLFMVDYEQLKSERMSREFLEKYINHQFELCDTEFEDIVEHYENSFLADSFWDEKSDYIIENGKKLKRNIAEHGQKILVSIQREIQNLQDSIKNGNASEQDERINKMHLEYLLDVEARLQSRMKNPRKVKRYLADIQSKLTIVDLVWFQDENPGKNEYSLEDWVETIHDIAFLKAFLFEEYDELIKAKSFYIFKKDEKNSYVVEFILNGFGAWLTLNERKEEVIEKVIYKLYSLDINTDKSQHQKLIEEIEAGSLQEEKLNLYVNECLGLNFNFHRMEKILNYIEDHNFKSQRDKCEIMVNIISILSGNYDIYIDGLIDIMKRVKIIIDRERAEGDFNEKERRLIEHYMQVLQTRLIFGNSSNICILLGILHNEDFTGDFENKNIDSISQLCNIILKVNESFPLPEFNKADTELNTLKNYFERMKVEFSEERFSYAETEIMYFWEKVEYALEILEIWFGNFNSLNQDVTDLREYYDNVKGEFNQSALKNANNLTKALREVENYILAHPEDINPGGAFIKLLFDIEKIDKDNHDYWGKDKRKVIIALSNIYEKFEKSPVFIRAFGDRWIFCKIRLFQLRRNMNM